MKWRCVHEDAITIEERYCRGEWGIPKSQASNATIPVQSWCDRNASIGLKTVTVEVKAGTAVRRYSAVKATGPDDHCVRFSCQGVPMRGQTTSSSGLSNPQHGSSEWGWVKLASATSLSRYLAEDGRG